MPCLSRGCYEVGLSCRHATCVIVTCGSPFCTIMSEDLRRRFGSAVFSCGFNVRRGSSDDGQDVKGEFVSSD